MPKVKNEYGPYPRINDLVRKNYKGEVEWPDGSTTYVEGLNQEEIAVLLGTPKKDRYKISYYENGIEEIPLSLLVKMADILHASIDLLLKRPFDISYNSQNNGLPTLLLSRANDKVLFIDDSAKGFVHLDEKFPEDSSTLKAFVLQTDSDTLDLKKGSLIIVDTNIKKYINTSTSKRHMCMMTTQYLSQDGKGYSARQGIYFSSVGIAQDLNGRDKKRSFYYSDLENQIKIVGCQVVQRAAFGVVIQAVKYFVK